MLLDYGVDGHDKSQKYQAKIQDNVCASNALQKTL